MKTVLFIAMTGVLLMPALSCNNGRTDNTADSTGTAPVTDMNERTADPDEYNQQLTYKQYSFSVNSKGQGALRKLTITGKEGSNEMATVNAPMEGTIYYASTADLNKDGRPEVYCFTRGVDSAGYSKVYAYAYDSKTGKQINFPDLSPTQRQEYKGHDSIYIDNEYIVRSFSTDDSKSPSDRKMIRYVLRPVDTAFTLVQTQ
ncbi:hypothetical protein L3C95_26245 [Chitinophaga filiformis]|uniref:hypothetical protein n=1 Tax=Chitinophaga filiformis TaxID=104663 RepID=UPI001F3F8CE0|nr:hypothetical protein [Chitinophaga filiformis]MCF6406424.1 hypothetical protein [Chitinophaga filiformis]